MFMEKYGLTLLKKPQEVTNKESVSMSYCGTLKICFSICIIYKQQWVIFLYFGNKNTDWQYIISFVSKMPRSYIQDLNSMTVKLMITEDWQVCQLPNFEV